MILLKNGFFGKNRNADIEVTCGFFQKSGVFQQYH